MEELENYLPEEGRLIRIERTPETERMGIAEWEGYAQGDGLPDFGIFFFSPAGLLPGDHKLGISLSIPWWYVENKESS